MEPEQRRPSDAVLILAALGAVGAAALAWLVVLMLLRSTF
jgi:hypothetical protein